MKELRQLLPPHQKALAEFINGQLWADIKLCLAEREPEHPDVKDQSHIAAGKGHQRTGFSKAIEAIEKLPFETPQQPNDPFNRPALDTRD